MTHIRFDDDEMEAELPPPQQQSAAGQDMASFGSCSVAPLLLPMTGTQGTQLLTPHCCSSVLVDYSPKDPAYVFRLVLNPTTQALAASTSSNLVKLYSLPDGPSSISTGQGLTHVGNLEGHAGTITGLEYAPDQPTIIYTSSADGSVRAWDMRTGQQAQSFTAQGHQLLCVGVQEQLLAAGGQGEVFFWDRRSGQAMTKMEDTHMDDVTQVRFCPSSSRHVISGSLDGLVAVHDTAHALTHDDAFVAAINVGTSVEELGTYGNQDSRLWVRTGTETLHLWEWGRTAAEDLAQEGGEGAFAGFEEARETLAAAARGVGGAAAREFGDGVGYIAGCHYDAASGQLMVMAGNEGNLGFWPVVEQPCGSGSGAMVGASMAGPAMVLAGAHTAIVRSVVCGNGLGSGVCCVTGGEDAKICLWSLDPGLVGAGAGVQRQGQAGAGVRRGGAAGRGGRMPGGEGGGGGPVRGNGGLQTERQGGERGRGRRKGGHMDKQNKRPTPY